MMRLNVLKLGTPPWDLGYLGEQEPALPIRGVSWGASEAGDSPAPGTQVDLSRIPLIGCSGYLRMLYLCFTGRKTPGQRR